MPALGALIGAILNAVLNAIIKGFSDRRKDLDRVDAHERAARSEGESETNDTIADIAAERGDIGDMPDSASSLSSELRRRKTGARNFGNPGKGNAGGSQG